MLVYALKATKKRTDNTRSTCTQANMLAVFPLTTAKHRCWWRTLVNTTKSLRLLRSLTSPRLLR